MTGGSGSRFRSDHTRRDIIEVGRNETDKKFGATKIADFLQEKLVEINAHDYNAINQHKKLIEDKLKNEFEVKNVRFGGSHSTHTDVYNG